MTSLKNEEVNYRELGVFFFPIALSAILMMTSHSIISSALARTTNAEISLAAFSVASSISMLFESPCYNIRQMVIALSDDRGSLKSIVAVGILVLIVSITLMGLVSFTNLGKVIFINIAGIRPELFPEVISSFRLLMLLPILSAVRAYFQGVLIVKKRTYWLTINVSIRLVFMLFISAFILNQTKLDNSLVGVVIFVSGMAVESILSVLTGKRYFKNFSNSPEKTKSTITIRETLVFFAPLVLASFSQTLTRPSINAGLARVENPDIALASFQVAYSYAMIFIVLLFYIHQLVLVFVKDKSSFIKVRNFIILVALLITGFLLISGLTPIGHFLLERLIGVEESLAKESLRTIAFYSLIPILLGMGEMYMGFLMKAKKTFDITIAKTINVIVVIISSSFLSIILPTLGGPIASISLSVGFSIELIYMWLKARKLTII
jgi:hypothetical protein